MAQDSIFGSEITGAVALHIFPLFYQKKCLKIDQKSISCHDYKIMGITKNSAQQNTHES